MSTLRDLFTIHLDESVHGRPADRGWLLRTGVVDLVAPFVTRLPTDPGDLTRFAGLDGSTAALLLERLTPERLEDRQNASPTLGTLLAAAAEHPDQLELHGYLVGPGRTDERITVDGAYVYGIDEPLAPILVWALAQHLGIGDALAPPDQVTPQVTPWRPNETCWSLEWD